MNINLLTDAPKHNLALMKISTYHKRYGDKVYLNGVGKFDLTYGSWLYKNSMKGICDIEGGPAIDPTIRLNGFETEKPDYDLYGYKFSIGFTWSYCPRQCPFCIVPEQNNPKEHHSIWEFHNSEFKEICLMNNNTFSDSQWKETFEEIWDAKLTVRDENGYDLRFIQEEQAEALKKTKFNTYIHYAWDLMENETLVLRGLKIAPKGLVYVLIGYNTGIEEDFYRCQKIHDLKHDPYVMPFNGTVKERKFQRFINSRMYRKYKTIKEGWEHYKYKF